MVRPDRRANTFQSSLSSFFTKSEILQYVYLYHGSEPGTSLAGRRGAATIRRVSLAIVQFAGRLHCNFTSLAAH